MKSALSQWISPRASAAEGAGTAARWRIGAQFGPDLLRSGMDPLSVVRYLATMGTVVQVAVREERVPPLPALDPERCFLGFDLVLDSTAGRAALEEAFAFIIDDCRLQIEADAAHAAGHAPATEAVGRHCQPSARPCETLPGR